MRDERRLAFGDVAELYDHSRPSYPEALVADVIDYARAGTALEVGAGTGKATVQFAKRGVDVHALEPSAAMASLARRNCAAYEWVTIEQSDFEHYDGDRAGFDLVYSAQAWHWVTPEIRYAKARRLLAAGGGLAIFWNRPRWTDSPLRDQLRVAYERAAPDFGARPGPMHPATEAQPALWGDWQRELEHAPQFEEIQTRVYEWAREYTTGQYLSLLQTHSDHIVLGEERRSALLAQVGAVIDGHGGAIPVNYVTLLCLARAL